MLDILILFLRYDFHGISSSNNRFFLAAKNKGKEEGFSILEVLVTILVITGFILGSLQATVLATFMRVQAQDKQEVTNWVQQDLELIRYQAFTLDNPNALPSPFIDPPSPLAKSEACGRYGNRLRASIIGQYPVSETVDINGRRYRVTRTYNPGDNTTFNNILQINYQVEYAASSGAIPAHPRYKSGGDNIVTTLSTEVLPDAALECP